MKKAAQYTLLLFFTFIVAVFLFEGLLRVVGIYSTYFEKNYNSYKSYYSEECLDSHIYTRKANSKIELKQNEFIYYRNTNELGLSQSQFPDTSGKIFSIILGDSFTEGIGAPKDSTWPLLLEQLSYKECPISTYNAGVGGSDIFFMRKLYEEKLMKLNPDLVMLCLNYSDISEFIYRGGNERFKTNGQTCFPNGPKWEKYYRYSHTFRFIIHFILQHDFTLKKKDWLKEQIPLALKKMANEIIWIKEHSDDLVLIIHPYPYFKDKKVPFHNEFQDISKYLPNDLKIINLYKDFEDFFHKKNSHQYYWEKDGHFNSKGYLVMSKFIYKKMKSQDICNK